LLFGMPSACRTSLAVLEEALSSIQAELAGLNEVLASPDAAAATVSELVVAFDAITRAASAGWTLSAQRAAELEAYTLSGHRNAADWLAQQAGVTFAKAKETLDLKERLEASRPFQESFVRGELSPTQATTIGQGIGAAPESAADLLKVARSGSHQELCQAVIKVKQSARSRDDERMRSARAFDRRALRFTQLPEGGVRVQVYLTDEAWARCLPRLDQRADVLFRRGRSAKVHATRDQYRADALVDLLAGAPEEADSDSESESESESDTEPVSVSVSGSEPGTGSGPGTKSSDATRRMPRETSATVIVRVDAASLRRGWVVPGEMCEIAGIGPVSVDTARELLGEWYVRLLVVDGADVTTITGRHRHIPARVEAALFERDRECVVPGCTVSIGLETHHWQVEVRHDGPSRLDNLCRICSIHHDLASSGGWIISGGPGRWKWAAPDYPVSDKLRQTRRRVSAARGRSPTDQQR
jgi:hypothetical protein